MKFYEIGLRNAYLIDLEERVDERGFFARAWCMREFEENGLLPRMVQANISFNKNKGTLRGMHYQIAPYHEAKLVRCTRGAIFDVIIDLREGSPTFKNWFGVELNEHNRKMIFVPEGFGHGFQTLVDNTEVFYQVSEFYTPSAEKGLRYNDPVIRVDWPLPVSTISGKDASWPDYA